MEGSREDVLIMLFLDLGAGYPSDWKFSLYFLHVHFSVCTLYSTTIFVSVCASIYFVSTTNRSIAPHSWLV